MKSRTIFALSTTLLFGATLAGANEGTWHDRVGSNSFSDDSRAADSPAMVKVPPNGMPAEDMSTVDSGGNGMSRRDHFDIYSEENAPNKHRAHRAMRHEWTSDESVSRSGAPMPMEHYVAFYGEDIPALRGLQLETALNQLHHLNMKEVQLAKLAETRAKSEDVLNLAHRIRADHEALETKVQSLARHRNISLESFQLATYEKAVLDRLNKLSGPEFETAFLRVNDRGNEAAATALRMVRNDLNDTEARNLINEALPIMTAHLATSMERSRARARTEEGDLGE